MTSASTQKLVADLRVLVDDSEELIKATAAQTGDRIADLRGRLQQAAAEIKPRLARTEALLEAKAAAAAAGADAYVRASPWTAVGAAAGIGFLIGLLAGRR